MEGFIRSFLPILAKFKSETILLTTAVVIGIISVAFYLVSQNTKEKEIDLISFKENSSNVNNTKTIFVDLAGSVEKPDIYEVSSGARLRDVLILSGGLSQGADRNFFNRNFNLARKLQDQEKIYIPSIQEVKEGVPIEPQKVPSYNVLGLDESKIHINTGSLEQLDSIPGIGKITAQKIIQGRPYDSLDQLVSKKVIYQSIFDKIKDQIDL